ncbi:UbiA family prenyltransferase [Saccharothrix sp.]|uniref:UbiA family prenyltransferase n=1 Tax=Saccharothrix sp. TaxID=1873460 RepID=UPI0028115B5C|nr:UbiA family prenyltransferase [Saccharothrix sp.]
MTTTESPRLTVPEPVRRPGFLRKLDWSLRIRRIEFFPVWLSVMLVPALLSVDTAADLLSGTFALTLVTVLAVVHIADMVNTLADREVDATYKSRLSEAVYGLGVRNVRRQIGVTAVVGAALAVALSAHTGHWDLLPLIAVETALVAQYSVPPLHFKTRGVFQPLIAVVIIIWIPMTIVVRALGGEFDWPLVATVAGVGAALIGIIVVNTAEDLPEDRAHGIRTSVIALGLPRAMVFATGMVCVGGTVAIAGLLAEGGPTFGLLPLVAAVGFAASHVLGTARLVRRKSEVDGLALLRPRAKLVPLQVATTGWATVIAAAFVLAGR